ncbi:hypothetical protein GCM10010232_45280 [Streptomyces amakusaensis]|uniref:Uncharacterized protein n=1 Tax=Streptomyces amakusaensis TaxID=67271 RepID=A0ABW0APF2_9ACTN
MHVLEDPSELSARAREFLRRTGRRERPARFEPPVEFWRVHGRGGGLVPAPMDLIIRCEGFERRYGGLRYRVRQSTAVDGERYETVREWAYDHFGMETRAWPDPRGKGWYFEWAGERVSKPCRDLLHTDGGVGTDVDGGSPYLPLAPSVAALIESHALMDAVAAWRPWPVSGPLAASAVGLLDGLAEVPEASWPSSRWRMSDTVAVRDSDTWERRNPRRLIRLWSLGAAGDDRVRAALEAAKAIAAAGRPFGPPQVAGARRRS